MIYLPQRNEQGQGLTEYAIILALVAVVVVVILVVLGPQVANLYSRVTNGLSR
jgi:pilus assembly protein Flp/PilA